MYLFIHYAQNHFPDFLPESFYAVDVQVLYSNNIDKEDYLYKINEEEYFLNRISEFLDKSDYWNIQAIIINKDLDGGSWKRATGLAGHIVCMKYSKCKLNKLPIILTDINELNIEDPTIGHIINNFFQTQGFYFRQHHKVFKKTIDPITDKEKFAIDIEINDLKLPSFQDLNITPPSSSHQSTNEWGAMRLASNFGLSESLKIEFPKHLYFKYINTFLNYNVSNKNTELSDTFKKILLIDDNADLGWKGLIEAIFTRSLMKKEFPCEVRLIKSYDSYLNFKKEINATEFSYDLILLDLYLDTTSDSTNAIKILRFLKQTYPHVPVVIFTASEKTLNYIDILDKGADGIYIKESPLHVKDKKYSETNHKSFKETFSGVYNKYVELKPYWIAIEYIIKNPSYLLIENGDRKFRDRIEERLKMFYGLLKKGYEQTEYDKNKFIYSGYELAFMTLWSVLNEIQEMKYNKTGSYFAKDETWVLKKNNELLFSWVLSDNSTESKIELCKELHIESKIQSSPKFYTYKLIVNTKSTPSNSIALQIAFIIYYSYDKIDNRKDKWLKNLFCLNKIRNELYLTHGDSVDYYDKTLSESSNRSNIKNNIKDLFILISFLLISSEDIFQELSLD